jgi:glycosyltransferase involved in cell wall biosynthesis
MQNKISRIRVVQMIDTLSAGGAERVAVNLANLLPSERYQSFLCATRYAGTLENLIQPQVSFFCPARKHMVDIGGLLRLARFIREHDIQLIHAHSSALFIAAQLTFFPPHPRVLWHDHHGRAAVERRPAWLHRLATTRIGGIIGVNDELKAWAISALHFPANRVWYVPNFVMPASVPPEPLQLAGTKGKRVVCVANLRPEKDHGTLVAAFAQVIARHPDAHLFLAGSAVNAACAQTIKDKIQTSGLAAHVTVLGEQQNVGALLQACDIGVLSSASEGLPLALLEYGSAGLPAIATRVGQCPEVLEDGLAGLLVNPGNASALAEALLTYLDSADKRAHYGEYFQQRVQARHSPQAALAQITDIYDLLLPSTQE